MTLAAKNTTKITATLHIDKRDSKYYVHLSWYEDGKRKQKCLSQV